MQEDVKISLRAYTELKDKISYLEDRVKDLETQKNEVAENFIKIFSKLNIKKVLSFEQLNDFMIENCDFQFVFHLKDNLSSKENHIVFGSANGAKTIYRFYLKGI